MTTFSSSPRLHSNESAIAPAPAPTAIRRRPAGPRSLPLVGALPQFRKDPLAFLMNNAEQHGDLASWGRVMGREWFQVSSAELTQDILQTRSKRFGRGISLKFLHLLGSDNLTLSEGDAWMKRRRMLQPLFGRRQLGGFANLVTKRLAEAMEPWDRAADEGRSLPVAREMDRLMMEVALDAFFGTRLREDSDELSHAAFSVLDYVSYRAMHPLSLPLAIPTARNRGFKKSCAVINRVVDRIIGERRQSGEVRDDVLSTLMAARDETTAAALTDAEVRSEIIEFFMAGHETTANMLKWTWWMLATHPEALRRVQEEVDAVVGNRLPTLDDVFALEYLRRVCDETMRLHPPAYMYARAPNEDDTIGGYSIPAGSILIISPYVLHHHPKYWNDPETFDPDRFLPENDQPRHRFAFLPFGGGRRVCIGSDFAMIEAMLLIAMVVQRYTLRPATNEAPENYVGWMLTPRNELHLELARRNGAERPALEPTTDARPRVEATTSTTASRCPFHRLLGISEPARR